MNFSGCSNCHLIVFIGSFGSQVHLFLCLLFHYGIFHFPAGTNFLPVMSLLQLFTMYHAKKFSTKPLVPHKSQGTEQLTDIGGLPGTTGNNSNNSGGSSKQRLRWTSDLHDRFVDAIAQLGGPDSGYFLFSNSGLILDTR